MQSDLTARLPEEPQSALWLRKELPADEPPSEAMFTARVRLLGSIRELWTFRELILTLAERDLRVRYKQAVLGLAWAVLTPLLLVGALNLIFNRVTHVETQGAKYVVFAYLGIIPWTFFSSALSRGGLSLVTNLALVNKVYCPREVFPLASIALAAADALIATLILIVIWPIVGQPIHVEVLYAPLLLAVAALFTVAVTIAFAGVVVYLRDLQVLLPMIVQFGLFLTPVAYSSSAVGKGTTKQAIYAAVNPLVPAIDGLRRGALFGQAPQWVPLGVGGGSALIMLVVAMAIFKRMETGFADIA